MSAKISASRKKAFLKALGETGNVTVSAERTKVSRSWVLLHRKGDPAFDAACREALAAARASLDRARDQRGMVPPKGWGHLDGVQLVVRGTNGRRTQIARARLKQWCPRTEDRFLAALGATCNVKAACAEVGMWPPSAYAHRERWPAFARAWHAAVEMGYARIEWALIENGRNLFSDTELPPDAPMPQMTVADAIHILHMHKREVRGVGGRPGLIARDPDIEEVRADVMRRIAAMERGRAVSAATRARDRAEWARRSG